MRSANYNRPMHSCRFHGAAAHEARCIQRGFTLIEIMVVIVILGVLAALVVPRVLERPDEARAIAAKSDIATLLAGAEAVSPRQPALSDRRAGTRGAGHAPRAAAAAAELEAERLPRQAAARIPGADRTSI